MSLKTSTATRLDADRSTGGTPNAGRGVRRIKARRGRIAIALTAVALLVGALLPQYASAEATIAPEPAEGAPGLPNGRVYEQVSPANKDGREALGYNTGLVAPDGNAVLYVTSGPVGSNNDTGLYGTHASRRENGKWLTASAEPRLLEPIVYPDEGVSGITLQPSENFARMLFADNAKQSFVSQQPPRGEAADVYLFTTPFSAPATEPQWLGAPRAAEPMPAVGHGGRYLVSGASANLSTIYFAYSGTLLEADAPRRPHIDSGTGEASGYTGENDTAPWGLYEWSEAGGLQEAGVLPDGSVPAYGAMPAAQIGEDENKGKFRFTLQDSRAYAFQAERLNNQVAGDGDEAFFVSPDPVASTVTNIYGCEVSPCTSEPPELYARESTASGAKKTVLLSRSQLAGEEGHPAANGVLAIRDTEVDGGACGNQCGSDVYASPDGVHAFFVSEDRLTSAAPTGTAPKMYNFDLQTEEMEYLPGVEGSIVAVSPDGSAFIFEDTSATPARLQLWTAGPGGGKVTTIAELPTPEPNKESGFGTQITVDSGHFSSNEAALVFRTNAPVPGGFNNGGGWAQLYRYAIAGEELACVSCPKPGVVPTGNVNVSYDNKGDVSREAGDQAGQPTTLTEAPVISANGARVFFDSPNALVAQDVNGQRDVYEWEDGKRYLISTGASSEPSYIVGSSLTGGDVFFATSEGLLKSDTDGAYDVYDARIPRPGDTPAPAAVPCEGAVCQGPPSAPQLLGSPASASFDGAGNLTPPPAKPTAGTKKELTRKRKLHRALKACDKLYAHHRRKRLKCRRDARRRLGRAKPRPHRGLTACTQKHRQDRSRRRRCRRSARGRHRTDRASRQHGGGHRGARDGRHDRRGK